MMVRLRNHEKSVGLTILVFCGLLNNNTQKIFTKLRNDQFISCFIIMTIRFNLVESLLSIIAVASFIVEQASADCLANEGFNEFFEGLNGGVPIPTEGSCCQKDVCNIPCPEEVSDPAVGKSTT
jgi:hypothetical protein